jgi:hypothetical protein
MKIQSLFERNIGRNINGVVKADQLDDSSVWQELDEFVVTTELDKHLRTFFSTYGEAISKMSEPDVAGKIGVWVSGFFGSGKSHFIKVLSYLLRNNTHAYDGQSRQAVEFFESKIKDAMLFGDIKRAVASNTDVILFNIDSKADQRQGREAILAVFLKVLNEMQGYSGDHPHLAHLERYLEGKGKYEQFKQAFHAASGNPWEDERDAYQFNRDEVAKALSETLNMSLESAEKWVDGDESSFALTIENFCKWVKAYLDKKGPEHRIIFLVDEIGQFIGSDSHLMLSLQTITEELGTVCKGRAWVVVTSQEDIDAVLGEMPKTKANDFSKIQGRFKTRLSLSSTNVDEVIQSRLLAKNFTAKDELTALFQTKGDVLKNQLTFTNCGMTLKPYKDAADFVKNYPFAPYQFQLVQKIFEAIRRAGATGMHLARGERSLLDAFQSAAVSIANRDVGVLVPLYLFYPSIENFLDTAVKLTIEQAATNPSLEQPFDNQLLRVLFLIRYVEEMKANVDNLVTLCLVEVDGDRLALRRKIEESLQRLEKETLISRNGDLYSFLTNEERDINREIKDVNIPDGDDSKLVGELIFDDILKGQRKFRYSVNKMDFAFNRFCDDYATGTRTDGALQVALITPLNDEYELYDNSQCVLDSAGDGGQVLIRLGNDVNLGRELRTYLQTEIYRKRPSNNVQDSTRKILVQIAADNLSRRGRLITLLGDLLTAADVFVAGQQLKLKASTAADALNETLEYLVQNSFTKMGYLKYLNPAPEKELQSILRSNDVAQQTLALAMPEANKDALDDLRNYIQLSTNANKQIILHDLLERRYALRPYGWPDNEVLILIARLIVLGEISLMMDGGLLATDKVYDAITTPAKRRKIVVLKKQASDPQAIQNARTLGKNLFHENAPDGEDAVFEFLKQKLSRWRVALEGFKPLADTEKYPGKAQIDDGLAIVKKLLSFDDSYKFIEHFNSRKDDLQDLSDDFHDLQHFYEHQRSTWERLRNASERFQLNRMELERDTRAKTALQRMQEILQAPSPYGLIREADALITTVSGINTALVAEQQKQAREKVNGLIQTLTHDLDAAQADSSLRTTCLQPLETLRLQVDTEESLAHLSQFAAEALKACDAGITRIEEFVRQAAEAKAAQAGAAETTAPKPILKKQRIVEPAKLTKSAYLETKEDVQAFIEALRQELETAIENNERIQIR